MGVPSLKKIMPNNSTLNEGKKRAPTWSKDHEASNFEDVNITNPNDEAETEAETEADPFRLVDLFAMMGREPTRKETALLNGLNNARQRRDRNMDGDGILTKEEKLIGEEGVLQANQLIQTHIAKSLQYCTVLSSPSFLATFLYLQMFGYLIYFGVLFIVLAVPLSQSLFWIT